MAFINEFISADDVVNYNIAKIDRYYLRSHFRPHWTIDHDRGIYLRLVASGRDEFAGDHTYTFYWNENLIELDLSENVKKISELMTSINCFLIKMSLPSHLESKHSEILVDLKNALVVRNGSGVYSSGITVQTAFEF